ncbi:MAG: phosphatase PAP2 family protein [Eubacteriaceae bacterium]|nr:phosphatase PAP2 family protein [Eubacteriaceae bacterium]
MKLLWFLAGIRSEFLTAVIRYAALVGEEVFIMVMMLVIYWCLNKDMAYRIGFAYFFSGLGVQTMKVIFRIPRPWVKDPSFPPVESALPSATGYSFPSGHTQTAAALFGSLMFNTSKLGYRLLCLFLILLVGFSRMYMGVHTPQDVIVALVFSLAVAWITDKVIDSRGKKDDILMAGVLIAVAAVCTGYVYYLYSSGLVEDAYLNDICKMTGAAVAFAVSMYVETKYINFSVKCARPWMQPVKLILGAGVLMGLKSGLKVVLGESAPASAVRYFIMIIWAMLIYPLIIASIQKKGNKDETDKLER